LNPITAGVNKIVSGNVVVIISAITPDPAIGSSVIALPSSAVLLVVSE